MRTRASFTIKAAAALLLAALGDWLFYGQWIGATLGGFALAWLAAVVIALPALRRRRSALLAAGAALLFAIALIDNPGLLAWTLFWTAISSAALLSRARFGDAAGWLQRLLLHIGFGTIRLFEDLVRLARLPGGNRTHGLARIASLLLLPVIGSAVFLALFASANPLIAEGIGRIAIPSPVEGIAHLIVIAFLLLGVWPTLRPHPRVTGLTPGTLPMPGLPSVPTASVALSLVTFNAVFALQNGLDIVFLWSGAPLPGTITLADYAHRGAYALIATALLAGLFVLTVLRPGGPGERKPAIRALVSLWVAQNLLLVASSILRTLDYIVAYSLTVLRIAAIAWMVLVGIGLALICWRLLRAKSGAWLINANALAATLMLTLFVAVDPSAVAAAWNVRHAREAGGPGQAIDLCYLRQQGGAALVPLIELESRVTDPGLRDRVRAVRQDVLAAVIEAQSDWHAWTWRGARRLALAQAALGPNPAHALPAQSGRGCDGSPTPAPSESPRIEGWVKPGLQTEKSDQLAQPSEATALRPQPGPAAPAHLQAPIRTTPPPAPSA